MSWRCNLSGHAYLPGRKTTIDNKTGVMTTTDYLKCRRCGDVTMERTHTSVGKGEENVDRS